MDGKNNTVLFANAIKLASGHDKILTGLLQDLAHAKEYHGSLHALVEDMKSLKTGIETLQKTFERPLDPDTQKKLSRIFRSSLDSLVKETLQELHKERIPALLLSCGKFAESASMRTQVLEELDMVIESLRQLAQLAQNAKARLE